MKKLLFALVAGGIIFSAVFAAAASLGLTADDLGAGDEVVATCSDSVKANYTTVLNTTTTDGPRYDLDDIFLTGLTDACNGQFYRINVLGSDGGSGMVSLGEEGDGVTASEVISGAPDPFYVDFDADYDIRAEDILHIAVVITGPAVNP
jgi:hypothetical protein